MAHPGWHAPVPVICCGNATAGGAGKTTVAMDLGRRLADRGIAAHFLLRGYGGTLKGPLRVDPAAHDSTGVGDEALIHIARLLKQGLRDGEVLARYGGEEFVAIVPASL